MSLNENIKIIDKFPAGTVTLPPSKSLSHRAVICASLAAGESVLKNVGSSKDIEATVSCMKKLGAKITQQDENMIVQDGQTASSDSVLDCCESGSTLRFLIPIAALDGKEHIFTGQGLLMQRPLDVYTDVFNQMGVKLELDGNTVKVCGPLKSGNYSMRGDVSSQFISGLLFALPLVDGDSTISITTDLESADYVNMTVDVMERFGVQIKWEENIFHIKGGQQYKPTEYTVEGDYSQAAFFLAAAALGRPVRCAGLRHSSIQGDGAILDILKKMGARVRNTHGLVSVHADRLTAVTIDAREIPDLVPPLAALCCFCDGESKIINAGRLRIKESDRLDAMYTELKNLGAQIEQGEDSLTITGQKTLTGGNTDAHGDHRIAMAVAVAAIRCEHSVALSGWEHVSKSYPAFWEDFEKEAYNV